MKIRLSVFAAVILALQCVALADSTGSFDNQGGSLTAVELGTTGNYFLSVPSSRLVSVSGVAGLNCGGSNPNPCSGHFSYKTSAVPLSEINNVGGPPTDFAAGGSFTIIENGVTVFKGTFTSVGGNPAAVWTWTGNVGQNDYQWTLMGTVSGTYTVNGVTQTVSGALVQLTVQASSDPFGSGGNKKILISGGNANLPGVVPESGTLVLLGSGLIGIVLVVRRKYLSGLQS